MRKRTVQSVLARRHMFNNGGMVAPQPQPVGILGSSPSLIDTVIDTAVNESFSSDMGAGSLSMAQGGAAVNMQPSYVFNQGGIAKFAGGGAPRGTFSEDTDVSIQLPSLAYGAKPIDGVTIEQLINMTPTEKLERYAPRAAELSEDNIIGPQPFRNSMIPQTDGNSLFGGDSSPAEDAIVMGGGSILGFIDQAARGLSQVNAEAGQAMVDVGQFLFSGKNKKTGYVNKFQQIQEVNTLLRRLPDQSQEIEALTKQIVDENPNITGENLSKQVIDKLSFEVDQEDLAKIGNKLDADEGMGAVGDGMGPIDAGVADGDVSLEEAPQTIEEKIKKVQESDDAGDGGVSQAQEAQDMMSGKGAVGDGTTPAPASVVAKVFEEKKVNDKGEEVPKTKQDYIKEFKEDMPEYEGMSEEEKGFTIMEAGLKVMAGKSANAIENIAEGLKGVSKEFVKDKKAKRAFDQQVDLSAAKYSLTKLSEIDKLKQSDDRALTKFYDLSKATKDNPYGEEVFVSRSEILDAGGKLPPKYKSESFVLAQMKDASDLKAKLAKLTSDAVKDKTIGYKEAEKINSQLDLATRTFRSSEVGKQLISGVVSKVVKDPDDILGGAAVATDLFRQAMNTVGVKIDKKYSSKEEAANDIRRAFQLLIPITLGSSQSANSISNRDVQFLADAYVNSGFLKADGSLSLSLATGSAPILVKQLQGAMQKFTDSQNEALTIYDRNVSLIDNSYKKGRFGVEYFSPALKKIRPSAERFRAASTGKGTVVSRPYSYQLDPATGLMRPKGNKGTVFNNKFFSPSSANFNKIYGR